MNYLLYSGAVFLQGTVFIGTTYCQFMCHPLCLTRKISLIDSKINKIAQQINATVPDLDPVSIGYVDWTFWKVNDFTQTITKLRSQMGAYTDRMMHSIVRLPVNLETLFPHLQKHMARLRDDFCEKLKDTGPGWILLLWLVLLAAVPCKKGGGLALLVRCQQLTSLGQQTANCLHLALVLDRLVALVLKGDHWSDKHKVPASSVTASLLPSDLNQIPRDTLDENLLPLNSSVTDTAISDEKKGIDVKDLQDWSKLSLICLATYFVFKKVPYVKNSLVQSFSSLQLCFRGGDFKSSTLQDVCSISLPLFATYMTGLSAWVHVSTRTFLPLCYPTLMSHRILTSIPSEADKEVVAHCLQYIVTCMACLHAPYLFSHKHFEQLLKSLVLAHLL